MTPADLPPNEEERLRALDQLAVLDSTPEAAYDEIAELAAQICGTPIALVSLVAANRQWFKANLGLQGIGETPRDIAFCAHTLLRAEVLVIPDTHEDRRFADNPLVTEDPHIRFYAGAPLITRAGAAVGALCALDRTPRSLRGDQKRALEILSHQVTAQLETRRACLEAERNAAELRRLQMNKEKLYAILAHDLRSPVTGILGFAELLGHHLDDLDRDEVRTLAHSLGASAQAAYRLLENLLQWTMLETGEIVQKPVRIKLDDLWAQVLSLLMGNAIQKGVHVAAEPNPHAIVLADHKMLHSALQNLVSNAIKFTRSGGTVLLSTEAWEDRVEISVADTGIGMSREQVERLFHPEVRLSTPGTSGERGTGLGLLLCQQFVEKSGGTVTVDSRPGRGTTFVLSLPRAEGPLSPLPVVSSAAWTGTSWPP